MVLCDFRWIVEHPCQTQWVFRAQVGMTVVVDHSGKLHGKQKCSIKDVISNKEAVCLPKQKWQETYFLGPFGYVGKSSVIQVFHQKNFFNQYICYMLTKLVYKDFPSGGSCGGEGAQWPDPSIGLCLTKGHLGILLKFQAFSQRSSCWAASGSDMVPQARACLEETRHSSVIVNRFWTDMFNLLLLYKSHAAKCHRVELN